MAKSDYNGPMGGLYEALSEETRRDLEALCRGDKPGPMLPSTRNELAQCELFDGQGRVHETVVYEAIQHSRAK